MTPRTAPRPPRGRQSAPRGRPSAPCGCPSASRARRPAAPCRRRPSARRGAPTPALLAALLVAVAAAAGALPARLAAATHAAPEQLKDRVLAVVDGDPILASDLDRAVVVGLSQPNPGETDKAFRRRVLDGLIAQRLRFHEIDRFGMEQVPVDQIEKQVAEVRARFKDEATFRAKLKEVGLDEAGLRQIMARQLEVLTFVDERLGPQVFVGLDDIAAYYKKVLVPQLQQQHQPVPPLDDVRDRIRGVVREQRLTEELDRWTDELRGKATIASYLDKPPPDTLPPVVKRIELGRKPAAPPIPTPAPGAATVPPTAAPPTPPNPVKPPAPG
jgi:hypothetical protein